MLNKFKKYANVILMTSTLISYPLYASDYNLPFVNTSQLGNLYSDWATAALDASTAATNPAGLTKICNQQLMISAIGLQGRSKFSGFTNTIPSFTPNEVGSATTQLRAFMPTMFYSAPISNNIVFGIGLYSPFALGTKYKKDSIVRYAATRTKVVVLDLVPSIGFDLTQNLSAGIGLDIDRIAFTINHMFGFPLSIPDSELKNHLSGWGYGFHAGLLFDCATTRVGFNYNSQVVLHTTGDSEVYSATGRLKTNNQKATAPLPTLAQLSIQQDLTNRLTIMGTIFYTNWKTFQKLTLKNSMTPFGSTIPITIPFNYHDTFDYAIGLTFKATERLVLKTGVEFLNTPSNNHDRSLPDPIGKATIVAIGAHYQQNCQIGLDIGYAHSFFERTQINHVIPIEFATGHSSQYTNILGAQVTWDIV